MTRFAAIATLILLWPAAAAAQYTVRIDTRPVEPLSAQEFEFLVACTLAKHPDSTKRYARYHYQRRDAQTPEQNERDADSRLLVPSLEGCFTLQMGKQIPFSLDALVQRWAAAHKITERG